jgi:glycosyltransferase involved in cell wall biosynthesis
VLNGIDLGLFDKPNRVEARRQLGATEDDLLIGIANRLAPVKGIEYAIRAMPAVVEALPNARLVIIGEGPAETDLRREAADSGVADRIDFAGFRREVPRLLAAFDLVVQPSLWEGLSISLLEAMAAGRPLVACDVQGNRDVIEHGVNGLMVPPRNPVALAEAMMRILTDASLAKRLGKNAESDCRRRFSQQRMVEQTLAIYDRKPMVEEQEPEFAAASGASRG